jgi:hypothetical protein
MAIIAAGFAAGKDEAAVCKLAGYSEIKNMRRAQRKYEARQVIGREAHAL